jgi:hypothetical protein
MERRLRFIEARLQNSDLFGGQGHPRLNRT